MSFPLLRCYHRMKDKLHSCLLRILLHPPLKKKQGSEEDYFSCVWVGIRGVREPKLYPIFSPTKLKVRQNSFDCLSFCSSSCLSASLSACLPVFLPFYLPYGLSCFPIFFLFPLFPSFFLEIYSPTPFTVRRQGGLLDPPDPPSRTPLDIIAYC